MTRLKQIWGAKTLEFREGVGSLLGWKVDFLPNGKMKVTSLFYPSTEEAENSIVFDGENGMSSVFHIIAIPRLHLLACRLQRGMEGWTNE